MAVEDVQGLTVTRWWEPVVESPHVTVDQGAERVLEPQAEL